MHGFGPPGAKSMHIVAASALRGDFLYQNPKNAIFLAFFAYFFEDYLDFSGLQGGCASSRLDHGLKTHPGRLR